MRPIGNAFSGDRSVGCRDADDNSGTDQSRSGLASSATPPSTGPRPTPVSALSAQFAALPRLSPRSRSEQMRCDVLSRWEAWADPFVVAGGDRAQALLRLKHCLSGGEDSDFLDLTNLGLTTLPAHFPSNLEELCVANNYLSFLPENLPPKLKILDAAGNRIKSLPASLPATLVTLDLSSNELEALPDNLPASIVELNVSGNKLTALPVEMPRALKILEVFMNSIQALPESLPPGLEQLQVDNNSLTHLPETLPDSLRHLSVFGNRLVRLPEKLPSALTDLMACNNRLSSFPASLPGLLERMFVSDNLITMLPANLPPSLESLDLHRNRIVQLPNEIPASDRRRCQISLYDNPLLHSELERLLELTQSRQYRGPRFGFSMASQTITPSVRPLDIAIADWFELNDDAVITWRDVAKEHDASAFSAFLDRLRDTVNATDQIFVENTREWLKYLGRNPAVRQTTMQVAIGATEACEDRVSLVYNDMKKVRLTGDIDVGHYDHKLDQLVGIARGMFRLDMLEMIATRKVKGMNGVDPVEVYLGYQIKLKDALELVIDTSTMRFFKFSGLTEEDLKNAQHEVMVAENNDFAAYFSRWAPWKAVVKRLDQSAFESAEKELATIIEADFESRLHAFLDAENLTHDTDTKIAAGPGVAKRIADAVMVKFTTNFLEQRELSSTLKPYWQGMPT
jgi:hypothetical protein